MANPEHIKILKAGTKAWNDWRHKSPTVCPDLRDVDFENDVHTYKHFYDMPEFEAIDFSGADLHSITARNSFFNNCNFDNSSINFSDLCFSSFFGCSFVNVEMRVTRIGSAHFNNCFFSSSDLSYCSAEETDFSNSKITSCSLNNMSLVRTDFTNTTILETSVYGISAWDLIVDDAKQRDIIISDAEGAVTVDSIEIAQFIYLLIKNSKIRNIIDTITSKVVLILGRFTTERKKVLDELRVLLRKSGYVPVLFDFDKPRHRDLTETVSTLAHLSRFVIADITDAKSVPQELMQIVPNLPSVPIQPIIEEAHSEFVMFEHFERYQWVQNIAVYKPDNIDVFANDIIRRCEDVVKT